VSEFEIMGWALSAVLSIIAFAFAKRCRACGYLKFGLYHVRGFDLELAKAYRVCPKCGGRVEAGIIADDGIVFWNTGETGDINSDGLYVHFGKPPHNEA
jgi:predicted nucleic-acid-binding Zn-ribbon protein